MDLIYRAKKPETIKRFLLENNIPLKLVKSEEGKMMLFVNNDLKTKDDTMKKGDTIKIRIQDEKPESDIIPEDIPLDILFEDEYFLVVNKPSDMQVMISKTHPTGTLANALAFYYKKNGLGSQIHFINRLDKETSGLMLVAKNRFLKFLFSDRTDNSITNEYLAVVQGLMDIKRFCIELPISRSEGSIKREVSETGDECKTSYQVEREFDGFSLVRILSETGRTHQIRVHFSYFNYPIVGDLLYNKNRYPVKDMLLYSNLIRFRHPIKDQDVEVRLPASEEIRAFMKMHGALI
ncbi:MAG TPA: RluA family pseudouridine synthase [Bacillota bacterium]|nr:RluA family pseudouridine synthase [Bacillota bacterium]HPF42400.1 RluA family pseudouridine synthase [Bacillota bacterium]HPJ85387.1 RluA family pseudouridine synthase [Bacillota bacterium]HPQ61317.1 RluA family pseudouridine synthase [Bacillota bacterium]HRX91436.1 RluA family pseudouridine synthase [Candidatus Izemoplasmatales bacterium]